MQQVLRAPVLVAMLAPLISGAVYRTTSSAADSEYVTFDTESRQGYLAVAFGPSGDLLAATGEVHSSGRGHLTIWDVNTGTVVYRVPNLPQQCASLDFSPDGTLLAVACGDVNKTVYVFEQEDVRDERRWKIIRRLPRQPLPRPLFISDQVRFSVDGELLARSSYGPGPRGGHRPIAVEFRSTENFATVKGTFRSLEGLVSGLRFLKDDRLLIAQSGGPLLQVVDVTTSNIEKSLMIAEADTAYQPCIDVSPDFAQIATGGDGFLLVLDGGTLETRHRLGDVERSIEYEGVSFSPNGQIVAACGDHRLELWDVQSGRLRTSRRQYMVRHIAFSPDGSRLASNSAAERGIRVWDAAALLKSDVRERGLP